MSFTLSSHFVTHMSAFADSATTESGNLVAWVRVTVFQNAYGRKSDDEFTLYFNADGNTYAVERAQAYADAINAVTATKPIEEAA